MIIIYNYMIDSSHPVVVATASVALWCVLHNSEQARAVARGLLGGTPHNSKDERFQDSNFDGYNIIINKDNRNLDIRYQQNIICTTDKAKNALWKYLE
jgi:hypothetical protein